MFRGRVIKSTGSWYLVLLPDGRKLECRARGGLRLRTRLRSTNPIAVGDQVKGVVDDEGLGIIESIIDRKNYLIRKATNLSKEVHILAANLDVLFAIISLKEPEVPLRFLDRVLVTAEAYDIDAIVVVNKVDLMQGEQGRSRLKRVVGLYQKIGYKVLCLSAISGEGLEKLKEVLTGKTSVLTGFSGVGKSTLLNCLSPDLALRTAEISSSSQKGRHTTTFAEMFELEGDSFVIDTPGIKSLGVLGIEDHELSHFFPEMRQVLSGCKFSNCIHLNEPGCAVKEAVLSGYISEERYYSYLNILEGNDTYR